MCPLLNPAVGSALLFCLGLSLLSREGRSEPKERSREDSGERNPDEEPPLSSESADPATSDLQSVSIDDFDMPDEASFEPLWDATWDPNLSFTSPHCSLDLAGGARTEPLGESFYFYAVLSVPLRGCRSPGAEFALPRTGTAVKPARLVSFQEAGDSAEMGGRATLEQSDEGRRGSERGAESGKNPALGLPPLPKGFLTEFRSRVLGARGVDRSEERIDSLIRREKAAGILPELRLRGAHGFDQSLALASVGALPGESTTRGGSDLLVEARLTFRLQRFLVGDSEVSLERSRQTLLERAQDSLEDALDQLLIFRKASVLALAPDQTPEDVLEATLLAEGARIRLHVLTGGWFPLEGPLPGAPRPAARQ